MKEYTKNQANKRYQDSKGKGYYFSRLVDAYMLQANTLFKNSELNLSVDQINMSSLSMTGNIFQDVNIFTSIKLFSDYVNPTQFEKAKIHLFNEEGWRNKLQKSKEFQKFAVSNVVRHKLDRDDNRKVLSQDSRNNSVLFDGISK